jgi:hypothetical protein
MTSYSGCNCNALRGLEVTDLQIRRRKPLARAVSLRLRGFHRLLGTRRTSGFCRARTGSSANCTVMKTTTKIRIRATIRHKLGSPSL